METFGFIRKQDSFAIILPVLLGMFPFLDNIPQQASLGLKFSLSQHNPCSVTRLLLRVISTGLNRCLIAVSNVLEKTNIEKMH